jgi:hypothetical protein
MYERDDEVLPPSKAQDPIQELKNTAFLMSGLYQQLEAERSIITTASGQMTHAGKQFGEYLKKFGEIDKQIRNTIVKAIEEETAKAAEKMAAQVGDKVAKAAIAQVEAVTENLCKAASKAEQQLITYRESLEISTYWRWGGFILAALFGGLISAMVMHHYFPEQTFTKEQWEQMEWGQSFQALWPKLTRQDQERLNAINRGEKPAPEKRITKKRQQQATIIQETPAEEYNQY